MTNLTEQDGDRSRRLRRLPAIDAHEAPRTGRANEHRTNRAQDGRQATRSAGDVGAQETPRCTHGDPLSWESTAAGISCHHSTRRNAIVPFPWLHKHNDKIETLQKTCCQEGDYWRGSCVHDTDHHIWQEHSRRSRTPKGEGEILVLPGAKFQVTNGATKDEKGVWHGGEMKRQNPSAGGDLTGILGRRDGHEREIRPKSARPSNSQFVGAPRQPPTGRHEEPPPDEKHKNPIVRSSHRTSPRRGISRA